MTPLLGKSNFSKGIFANYQLLIEKKNLEVLKEPKVNNIAEYAAPYEKRKMGYLAIHNTKNQRSKKKANKLNRNVVVKLHRKKCYSTLAKEFINFNKLLQEKVPMEVFVGKCIINNLEKDYSQIIEFIKQTNKNRGKILCALDSKILNGIYNGLDCSDDRKLIRQAILLESPDHPLILKINSMTSSLNLKKDHEDVELELLKVIESQMPSKKVSENKIYKRNNYNS